MNLSQVVKTFMKRKAFSEFEETKSDDSLVRSLQILSATDDLSVFDPGSLEAAEFYSHLHDLLTHPTTESELVWCIISVLQVAVRNPNACSVLIHTYHFIHPLTTLLEAQVTSMRKLIVLNLLQELSYGVVICWQEAPLPKLMALLLDIITNGDPELVPVALGVMINLCHKNKPAIYTLKNCMDIKTLLRTILNIPLQRQNDETSIQVCKLLMVLNQLSGNVPDAEILLFVRANFKKISKAFNSGNMSLMRHIVDFFRDAKESEHGKKVLLTFPSYQEETAKLINMLKQKEVPESWQCVQYLVLFLKQLVDLELATMMPLFVGMTAAVLPWVQVEGVTAVVLDLLSAVLHQSRNRDADVYKGVYSCLENHLQVFVTMLHSGCKAESRWSEISDALTNLLSLLRELAINPSLSVTIAEAVDKKELKNLLLPLMSPSNNSESLMFQQPHTQSALYVEVLSFVSELSLDDKDWLFLYSDLLQKKPILRALAIALYCGPYETKKKILFLAGTNSFSKQCLTILSEFLSDLNQLFVLTPIHNQEKCVSSAQFQMDISLVPSVTEKENFSSLVQKLNNLCNKNEIQNLPLSEIMELYQFKVNEMQRTELYLRNSLAAADSHCTQLSHRVAQLSAETMRLHSLLYTGQLAVEGSQGEVTELRTQLQDAHKSATESHLKFKQLKQDVHSKSMIIKEQNEDILKFKQIIDENIRSFETLEKQIASLTKENEEKAIQIQKLEQKSAMLESQQDELVKKIQGMHSEKSDLQKSHSLLEKKVETLGQQLSEKDVTVEKKTSQIQTLEQEMARLSGLLKRFEKSAEEKDKEIAGLHNQLVDLEKMRKIINEITGGKKNNL